MSTCKRSGRASVHCWGCISHEGARVLPCIEGHLDGLQYQNILQNMMVPFVWMLYPDGIIHLQQDHSSSCGSRMGSAAGRRRTPWLATVSAWYEPHREYVEWGEKDNAGNLACPPRNSDELWALMQTCGMKLVRLCVTFDQWLVPWHDGLNQWSKQKCSGLLIKVVDFWKQPF